MTLRRSLWAAAAGLTAGAFVALRRSTAGPAAADRWLTVTINRSPADIQADKLPTPLQEYGDRIRTRIRPAPGDRATEVAVRLKDVPSDASSVPARLTGQDPRQDLRRSLREAKALLEAGKVSRCPSAPPTSRQTITRRRRRRALFRPDAPCFDRSVVAQRLTSETGPLQPCLVTRLLSRSAPYRRNPWRLVSYPLGDLEVGDLTTPCYVSSFP
ncbi:hypothetical protein ABTX60_36795 [Streptomyces sp. NPDC126510]|uniref:hypothetical protein n=1 Tax=Streptomyces sp. NPDC126510 TaxID=3155317 RepID=UPI0033223D14